MNYTLYCLGDYGKNSWREMHGGIKRLLVHSKHIIKGTHYEGKGRIDFIKIKCKQQIKLILVFQSIIDN